MYNSNDLATRGGVFLFCFLLFLCLPVVSLIGPYVLAPFCHEYINPKDWRAPHEHSVPEQLGCNRSQQQQNM